MFRKLFRKLIKNQRGVAATAYDSYVLQNFILSAKDATTATLVPSTHTFAEAKPTHLKSTQIILTYDATPANFYSTTTDDVNYIVEIRRTGG